MAFASFRVYGSEKREKTPMCKNQICRFDGDGILWLYSVVKEQRRVDPSLVPTGKPESYTHFGKIFLRKRKSSLRNWSERVAGVFLGTLFPRGNFYLLEDGRFTRHPCAQFEHMELWAHSLMIYYFQREIFTLWEATSSDYFPSGQIDHLELPIVIGSNWPNNTGHMLQSGKWANCPLTKKPSKQ